MTIDIIFLNAQGEKIHRLSVEDYLIPAAMSVGVDVLWNEKEFNMPTDPDTIKDSLELPMVKLVETLENTEVETQYQHGRYLDMLDLRGICNDLINLCNQHPQSSIVIFH